MTKYNLSKQPYKGTRDFYPDEMRIQRYIFDTWRKVAQKYGYDEVEGPIIEPTDLYRAKSGEEIVNEQIYNFEDRGGRDVTIRPEMTPTVARMVAAKHAELAFPLRWFSVPNLMRYERPQRGRLREHWQLNVDIFGVETLEAESEIILMASDIMKAFDAKSDQYKIKINSRKLVSILMGDYLKLSVDASHRLTKLIDRKDKMESELFENKVEDIIGDKTNRLMNVLSAKTMADLPDELTDTQAAKEVAILFKNLKKNNIDNAVFDLTLMRGFDYYTGIVFEVFDTHPENNRSLFGGGRYDHLVGMFDVNQVSAVGFGMGDVGIRNFLETHELLPGLASRTKVYMIVPNASYDEAQVLATKLRENGINVAVDFSGRKVGTQIKTALKDGIPYILFVGDREIEEGQYTLKDLSSEEEFSLSEEELISKLQ